MLVSKLISSITRLSILEEEKRSVLLICEELKKEIDRLNFINENDLLGDWPNRRGIFRQAERIFSEYDRGIYMSVSVAFIDLDKFKLINDTYGHKYGDEIIIKVADIIYSSIRKTDVFGRLSGDEFVIILPGSTQESAEAILERIKFNFRFTEFSFNTNRIPVSMTFGVVSTETTDVGTFEELLHKADVLMNNRKGNRVRQ